MKTIAQIFAVIGAAIGIVFSVMALSLLLCYPFKWTWNYVVPYLFDLKTLSVGQAWCLLFVLGTLFNRLSSKKG